MDIEKNIIITGSSGYIGRVLCKQLTANKTIIGIDSKEIYHQSKKITFIKADIKDKDLISTKFKIYSPDIVIHCAGIAHQKLGAVDTATYLRVNSEATEHLARSAASVNPDMHFLFLSTISVYGESYSTQSIAEDAVCIPSSDYASSKLDAERRLLRLYEEGLFRRLTILRLAPVYDREWSLNLDRRVFAPKKLAYLKFGKGTQRMSALARPNLVEFVEHLLKRTSASCGVEIFNVCDSNPYSFNQIIKSFKRSGIHPPRPTITIPLPFAWSATRIAGFVLKNQKVWLHSCYDKLALDLVFDHSKMLQTGFKPKHTLNSIFS